MNITNTKTREHAGLDLIRKAISVQNVSDVQARNNRHDMTFRCAVNRCSITYLNVENANYPVWFGQAAHCKLHCRAPHYPMQIRISQISCSAAGQLAIAAINNAPCYKYEPGAEPFSPPTKYTDRTLLCAGASPAAVAAVSPLRHLPSTTRTL